MLYALGKPLGGRMKEWRQMEDIQAIRHAMTMFYPAGAGQFLEAVLSISEKVSGLARKRSATSRKTQQQLSADEEPALLTCAWLNSDET
jgi:hypothetical protein